MGHLQKKPRFPTSTPAAGKKRDVSGNVRKQKDNQDALLKEILDLGGSKDDLDLVAGAASDEDGVSYDQASPQNVDREFATELSQFASGLGIKGSFSDGLVTENKKDRNDSPLEKGLFRKGKTTNYSVTKSTILASQDGIKHEKHPKTAINLMFDARADWHATDIAALPAPDILDAALFLESTRELKNYAFFLLQTDANTYFSKHLSSSSHEFVSTILSTGTLTDKVSALTLVVQESPVHTTKFFESLFGLAKKRSRSQAMMALEAIKDLLGTGVILPGNRRLFHFGSQPGLLGVLQRHKITCWKQGYPLPEGITKPHMILWAYEDWLKTTYFDVLKVLEIWCNDEIEFARNRAITYVYELLREKPEQESNLLRLLVNKLGDPDRKIASRTSYLILQLQEIHPLMKPIIIQAIENEVLLRPGQNIYAKYHAVNTLNQTILSIKEEDVTRKLLDIYFDLFMTLLGNNTFKAVTGPRVNRQIPNKRNERTKSGALRGVQGKDAKPSARVTTEKLVSAVLTGVNRALPYAKSDGATLEAHLDTLFRVTHSSNFNTSIRALILIQQLTASKNIAVDRFYRTLYESLLDPRLVSSSKHAMFLNLLFKALKSDHNVKRVKAFVKRLVQIITFHQPPFICGVLYLLKELEIAFPGLRSLIDAEECDGGENFFDIPDENATFSQTLSLNNNLNSKNKEVCYEANKANTYDPRKRDPEFSNADKSCLWELLPFAAHFHPSVSIFASRLLTSGEVPEKPDLASHTLIHFLDKFVYRNAKAMVGGLRGASIMQPAAGCESRDVLVSSRLARCKHGPLNSDAFWRRKVDEVAVDEVFFHSYFRRMGKGKQAPSKKDKSAKLMGDSKSEDTDESENEIWQALAKSQQEAEGYSTDCEDTDTLEQETLVDDVSDAGDLMSELESGEDPSITNFNDGTTMDIEWESESDVRSPFNDGLGPKQSTKPLVQSRKSRRKRRRLKNLPTFASIEDYAGILSDKDDEEIA